MSSSSRMASHSTTSSDPLRHEWVTIEGDASKILEQTLLHLLTARCLPFFSTLVRARWTCLSAAHAYFDVDRQEREHEVPPAALTVLVWCGGWSADLLQSVLPPSRDSSSVSEKCLVWRRQSYCFLRYPRSWRRKLW